MKLTIELDELQNRIFLDLLETCYLSIEQQLQMLDHELQTNENLTEIEKERLIGFVFQLSTQRVVLEHINSELKKESEPESKIITL